MAKIKYVNEALVAEVFYCRDLLLEMHLLTENVEKKTQSIPKNRIFT